MTQTVMVIVPHPDDAEFYAGGLLAKLKAEGARIIIVNTTDGSKGSFDYTPAQLIQIRAEEASAAAQILGAEPPIMLGFEDFTLSSLPIDVLREKYVRLIREFRPDVIIAEDAFSSNEIHPDHRAVAWAASDAINYAMLPLLYPEQIQEGLKPHYAVEKYFFSDDPRNVNKIVDITDVFDVKIAALLAHKSQVNFLVADIYNQARSAGLDLPGLLGELYNDPAAAFTWAMKSQAEDIGSQAGYSLGEAFHYVRYHPFIEAVLANQRT